MGFFSRKPKVRLDEFCREFCDTHLLHADVAGIKRSITEVEPRFAAVETERLMAEVTVIRFEVFGLAWLHQQGDKRAAEQSELTRLYLEESSRTDIWEAMESYNQAVARSSTLGKTTETPGGRAYLAFVNRMRADLFDAWSALGFAPVSVARAANRLSTDVA
jgi:hypothetical protein